MHLRTLLSEVGFLKTIRAATALVAALVLVSKIEAGNNLPFGVGEVLTFSVRYSGIRAGTATMSVKDTVDCNGTTCFRFVSVAKSTMPFSLFFEVCDSVESWAECSTLLSRRYEKKLLEGSYRKNEIVLFDHHGKVAIYPNDRKVELADSARDVLAALYYVRTLNLEVGKRVFVMNHADKKNYPLEVRVLKKETIKVPAGTFECLVVEPILKATGIFEQKGRLTVWLTNDDRRIPVMMKSKIVIGSVEAVLVDTKLDVEQVK